jgi:CheY-like chemotaxis protein
LRNKNNNAAIMLSPLQQKLSRNVSKNQDDNSFLAYYKVDPKTDIIKNNDLNRGRSSNNYNNDRSNDVLSSATDNPQTDNSQYRIMVVDDEHDITRLFAIGLESNGFAVNVFSDPLSALSNYKAGIYDLLLLDIRMPAMNGFELYQKINQIDDKAEVCFITAYEESINDFKRLFPNLEEVDCFVRKPIEIRNLVNIVKSKVGYN